MLIGGERIMIPKKERWHVGHLAWLNYDKCPKNNSCSAINLSFHFYYHRKSFYLLSFQILFTTYLCFVNCEKRVN